MLVTQRQRHRHRTLVERLKPQPLLQRRWTQVRANSRWWFQDSQTSIIDNKPFSVSEMFQDDKLYKLTCLLTHLLTHRYGYNSNVIYALIKSALHGRRFCTRTVQRETRAYKKRGNDGLIQSVCCVCSYSDWQQWCRCERAMPRLLAVAMRRRQHVLQIVIRSFLWQVSASVATAQLTNRLATS